MHLLLFVTMREESIHCFLVKWEFQLALSTKISNFIKIMVIFSKKNDTNSYVGKYYPSHVHIFSWSIV